MLASNGCAQMSDPQGEGPRSGVLERETSYRRTAQVCLEKVQAPITVASPQTSQSHTTPLHSHTLHTQS